MARNRFTKVIATAGLFVAGTGVAQAHHVANYASPATILDGLLSGLGHPVIGLDHFLFTVGAGVIAARFERGRWLPMIFVIASVFAAALRYLGSDAPIGELPVAVSLVVLGAMMLTAIQPGEWIIAILFLAAGTLHGHALAETIVGARPMPLAAYLVGLALVQSLVAVAAWSTARWAAVRAPGLPLQRLAGAAVGVAGIVFAGLAAL